MGSFNHCGMGVIGEKERKDNMKLKPKRRNDQGIRNI
jgi:hypothetical protein